LIGEGSFAKVFEGFDKIDKRPVAIKVIKKNVYIEKKKEYLL
jgi:serine/threonine protein kinase